MVHFPDAIVGCVMLDIKWIRENPDLLDKALADRGASAVSSGIISMDARKREAMSELQTLQSKKNEIAFQIGCGKKNKEDVSAQEKEAAGIKQAIQNANAVVEELTTKLDDVLAAIPNIPLADVPIGADETYNECIRVVGTPTAFDFAPKPHYEIGEMLGMVDFPCAAKISGSRFVVLRGAVARLERALKSFMLDMHTRNFGYQEVSVPVLVNSTSMYSTGQLPKFGEDSFETKDGRWLIPTSEVPLTNTVREMFLDSEDLPIRLTAFSTCFRSEAGAAGRDTRGMIRNHQFSKVELVSIVHPSEGVVELERMTSAAEAILQELELPYRVILLSTGDMGFTSKKTYDIEVWVPSESTYREISSCSFCGDFQARRMMTRYKDRSGQDKGFVHTLNGSGLAVGRTIVAILENYQLINGNVTIPRALVPYMNGLKEISKGEQ